MIAAEVYNRYDAGGPAGATRHPQRVAVAVSSQAPYDLCRGEWSGRVYSTQDEVKVQLLADALNELERHGSNATSKG